MAGFLVVEHRLATRTHATVNAGFLLALASTGARVLFAADPRHAEFVDEVLRFHGEALGGGSIDFRPLRVPRPLGEVTRVPFVAERGRVLRDLRGVVREAAPAGILYCSAATSDPFLLSSGPDRSVPTLVVVHEIDRLLTGVGGLLTRSMPLRMGRASAVRFAVLSPPALARVAQSRPKLRERFCAIPIPSIDHPLDAGNQHRGGLADSRAGALPRRGTTRFGRLGGDGRGGAEAFERVVRAVRQETQDASFVMVGSTSAKAPWADPDEVEGAGEAPLPYAEYCRRASSIDYAVWLGDVTQYALAASASAVDAVTFSRPLIALRNPYTEWLFETFGDIGQLCDTEAEMVEAIVCRTLRENPSEYAAQVASLRAAQDHFGIRRVGSLLREQFGLTA